MNENLESPQQAETAVLANLNTIPLFSELPADKLNIIADKTALACFDKNVVVLAEGEFTKSLYFVLSGRVKIYVNGKRGKIHFLNTIGPGKYFGELVLDKAPRATSVLTVEPCEFAVMSTIEFQNLLPEHPEIALQVIRDLSQINRELNENIRNLTMLDVYDRVSKMLLDLAGGQKGEVVIPKKLTQKEMASKVGTSREMINRILRDLAAGGYIRVKNQTIIIDKPLPPRC